MASFVGLNVELMAPERIGIAARSVINAHCILDGRGAVVTRDVPSLAIVAGVPARIIGERTNSLTYQLNFNPRFR